MPTRILFLSVIFFIAGLMPALAQEADTASIQDIDTLPVTYKTGNLNSLDSILYKNAFINIESSPDTYTISERNTENNDLIFYAIIFLFFLFGVSKTFFSKYFDTMFRVFFNTSLRQSQLTDQLMQAKLPSLVFNILFLATAAFYLSLLLDTSKESYISFTWNLYILVFISFIIIYLVKYLTLKFIGWITGYNQEADTYIFIIFLINKIVGICLLPVLIIMAYSGPLLVRITVILSFVFIGVMLIMRFLRSYGLLQHKLSVNGFHFLLYILALEILPLVLIYKAAMLYMSKIL